MHMSAPHLGIDDEDFSFDLIPAIEKSFGIRFGQTDFEQIKTYGEFCTLVYSKLPLACASDCTLQQAFYKLRKVLPTGTAAIEPNSLLADILPAQRVQRRLAAQAIERALNMKLDILGMPSLAQNVCFGLLIGSIFGLPVAALIGHITNSTIGWWACLASFTVSIIGLDIGTRLGTTIQFATVGEVVNAMSSRFYRQSRRDPSTANKSELARQLNILFSHHTGIEPAALTPDAILV